MQHAAAKDNVKSYISYGYSIQCTLPAQRDRQLLVTNLLVIIY